MRLHMVKSFNVWNKHYNGLSERWHVEVSYVDGGPHEHFEGTMEECGAYMRRTLVKTGQPFSDDAEHQTPQRKAPPVNQELFYRTAPRWNCVDYPGDGPHYLPGTGSCLWCGKTREQIGSEENGRQ